MKPFTVAKVLVINTEGKLLVLRRSATDERRPLQWDYPGGFVEPGEDLKAAAIRETLEEAGISLDHVELIHAHSEVRPDRGLSGSWLTFVAFVDATPEVTLSFEHDRYKWDEPQALLAEITYDLQHQSLAYALEHGLLKGVAS